jgi:hypothetical protein
LLVGAHGVPVVLLPGRVMPPPRVVHLTGCRRGDPVAASRLGLAVGRDGGLAEVALAAGEGLLEHAAGAWGHAEPGGSGPAIDFGAGPGRPVAQ